MDNFYFLSILSVAVFSISRKFGFLFTIIVCSVSLLFLESTNFDYEVYENAYENAYFQTEYPWFKTKSPLTSEPFYLWYTSLCGVFFPYGFSFFLAFNFLLCVVLSLLAFRFFKKDYFYFFWLFFLPVIFPTIFYFSPRSSISLIFAFLAMVYLARHKKIYFLFFLVLCINTHSQYIILLLMLMVTYFVFRYWLKDQTNLFFKGIIILALGLFVVLKAGDVIAAVASNFLHFLPSGKIVESKMGYLQRGRSGFRLTSVLSVLIYPYLMYQLYIYRIKNDKSLFFTFSKYYDFYFTFFLLAIIFYGASINLAFITKPHVAGRLSRMSDYLGMGIVLPTFFRVYYNNTSIVYLVLLFLAFIVPFVFGTLYLNVYWGF